jgi:molybdopterin/thiamine biosynthesis adenylyltransferase
MQIYITSNTLYDLRPGMNLHGKIHYAEETGFISSLYSTVQFPIIGQVLDKGTTLPPPKNNPWLYMYLNDNTPTIVLWVDQKLIHTDIVVVSDQDAFQRTPFDSECLDSLQNSTVTIFGCGTGGSYIALELARSGVSQFNLVDPDRMEIANLSRHEGGFKDLGRPKVSLVKERIIDIQQNAKVSCFFSDLFDCDTDNTLNTLFHESDLIIAATDKISIQLMINELAVNFKTPTIFGGCYENAIGGEVFAYVPEWNTPCLCCLKGGGNLVEQKRGPIDYSTATSRDDYVGQPGLRAAINFVSTVEVQMALGVLLRKHESEYDQIVNKDHVCWLIGGAFGQQTKPFHKPFHIIPVIFSGKRSDCSICKKIDMNEIQETEIEFCNQSIMENSRIWDTMDAHDIHP